MSRWSCPTILFQTHICRTQINVVNKPTRHKAGRVVNMQTEKCYSTSHCSCCKLVNRFTIELNSLEVTLKKKASLSEMEAPQGHKTIFEADACKGREKWPTQCQPRPFYSQAQKQPCCLYPLGAPNHLPLSCPFCWCKPNPKDIARSDITSSTSIEVIGG